VVRVAVPDLEQIARMYLVALEQADAGSAEWAANYEWMMLEMYDQAVRNRSGGEMAAYLSRECLPNRPFVLERVGHEARELMEKAARRRDLAREAVLESSGRRANAVRRVMRHLGSWKTWREWLARCLLGGDYAALQVGRFRQRGQHHQWMYDRYSLRLLLRDCGFQEIVRRQATESGIPEWASFGLDADPDGTVYKPDSLYMEGVRPA
jgi:hypothetical protein